MKISTYIDILIVIFNKFNIIVIFLLIYFKLYLDSYYYLIVYKNHK